MIVIFFGHQTSLLKTVIFYIVLNYTLSQQLHNLRVAACTAPLYIKSSSSIGTRTGALFSLKRIIIINIFSKRKYSSVNFVPISYTSAFGFPNNSYRSILRRCETTEARESPASRKAPRMKSNESMILLATSCNNLTLENDLLLRILKKSMQSIAVIDENSTTELTVENKNILLDINQSIEILNYLASQANAINPENCKTEWLSKHWKNHTILGNENPTQLQSCNTNVDSSMRLKLLSEATQFAVQSLHQLVHRISLTRNESGRKRTKKGHGVHAWKTLQCLTSFIWNDASTLPLKHGNSCKIRRFSKAIVVLAMGIFMSINSTVYDFSVEENESKLNILRCISKMVTSAVFPEQPIYIYSKSNDGSNCQLLEEDRMIYIVARAAVLNLLHLAAEQHQTIESREETAIDLQVISKLAHSFGVGNQNFTTASENGKDDELHSAVSGIVNAVFAGKLECHSADYMDNCEGKGNITKDITAAVLSLVAHAQPWNVVKADKLVTYAADCDLWFAAENICDSAVISGYSLQDSIAQSTTKAIIDAALEHRQYRRADQFTTKYYSFCGPERYAEARFLHACDTIAKLIKKKQPSIIEKQVERVDDAVARCRNDLNLISCPSQQNQSFDNRQEICINTMSRNVREYSLRRLYSANLNVAAIRLARLWSISYENDPIQLLQEIKEQKQNYLQWNDEGCPGYNLCHGAHGACTLPQLISDPKDLIHQFCSLQNTKGVIGFDAEWGNSPGVSVLQLSSMSKTLLLDITALTTSKEGCDALRMTVGKLFSGALGTQNVIGFSCKEDFSRLRASYSIVGDNGPIHWFPTTSKIIVRDLRQIIADTYPNLGNGKNQLGLSAACKFFLGKALDKSEQCSDWSVRPLSPEQREYAALDAWACVAIHKKIAEIHSNVLYQPYSHTS